MSQSNFSNFSVIIGNTDMAPGKTKIPNQSLSAVMEDQLVGVVPKEQEVIGNQTHKDHDQILSPIQEGQNSGKNDNA